MLCQRAVMRFAYHRLSLSVYVGVVRPATGYRKQNGYCSSEVGFVQDNRVQRHQRVISRVGIVKAQSAVDASLRFNRLSPIFVRLFVIVVVMIGRPEWRRAGK